MNAKKLKYTAEYLEFPLVDITTLHSVRRKNKEVRKENRDVKADARRRPQYGVCIAPPNVRRGSSGHTKCPQNSKSAKLRLMLSGIVIERQVE